MTHKEENIVNIAMRAAELLKDGKIERDDISGHMGLTESIISLADAFEKQNAGVDFNSECRDYWVEIDAFAEKHLLEEYGIEQAHEQKDLDIKVIVERGVVHAVLKNDDVPVNVEVLDIDPDYEDYEQLMDYRNQLCKDPSYFDCSYSVADFSESEPSFSFETYAPVTVYGESTGGVKTQLFSGDYDQCLEYFKSIGGLFTDENSFEWDLFIEDSREVSFPEGFHSAVSHYSDLSGTWIDCELVRKHADALTYCYDNNVMFSVFKGWAECEEALGEKVTFEEYCSIDENYDVPSLKDPAYSPFVEEIKGRLAAFREEKAQSSPRSSLKDIIAKAEDKRISQKLQAEEQNLSHDR